MRRRLNNTSAGLSQQPLAMTGMYSPATMAGTGAAGYSNMRELPTQVRIASSALRPLPASIKGVTSKSTATFQADMIVDVHPLARSADLWERSDFAQLGADAILVNGYYNQTVDVKDVDYVQHIAVPNGGIIIPISPRSTRKEIKGLTDKLRDYQYVCYDQIVISWTANNVNATNQVYVAYVSNPETVIPPTTKEWRSFSHKQFSAGEASLTFAIPKEILESVPSVIMESDGRWLMTETTSPTANVKADQGILLIWTSNTEGGDDFQNAVVGTFNVHMSISALDTRDVGTLEKSGGESSAVVGAYTPIGTGQEAINRSSSSWNNHYNRTCQRRFGGSAQNPVPLPKSFLKLGVAESLRRKLMAKWEKQWKLRSRNINPLALNYPITTFVQFLPTYGITGGDLDKALVQAALSSTGNDGGLVHSCIYLNNEFTERIYGIELYLHPEFLEKTMTMAQVRNARSRSLQQVQVETNVLTYQASSGGEKSSLATRGILFNGTRPNFMQAVYAEGTDFTTKPLVTFGPTQNGQSAFGTLEPMSSVQIASVDEKSLPYFALENGNCFVQSIVNNQTNGEAVGVLLGASEGSGILAQEALQVSSDVNLHPVAFRNFTALSPSGGGENAELGKRISWSPTGKQVIGYSPLNKKSLRDRTEQAIRRSTATVKTAKPSIEGAIPNFSIGDIGGIIGTIKNVADGVFSVGNAVIKQFTNAANDIITVVDGCLAYPAQIPAFQTTWTDDPATGAELKAIAPLMSQRSANLVPNNEYGLDFTESEVHSMHGIKVEISGQIADQVLLASPDSTKWLSEIYGTVGGVGLVNALKNDVGLNQAYNGLQVQGAGGITETTVTDHQSGPLLPPFHDNSRVELVCVPIVCVSGRPMDPERNPPLQNMILTQGFQHMTSTQERLNAYYYKGGNGGLSMTVIGAEGNEEVKFPYFAAAQLALSTSINMTFPWPKSWYDVQNGVEVDFGPEDPVYVHVCLAVYERLETPYNISSYSLAASLSAANSPIFNSVGIAPLYMTHDFDVTAIPEYSAVPSSKILSSPCYLASAAAGERVIGFADAHFPFREIGVMEPLDASRIPTMSCALATTELTAKCFQVDGSAAPELPGVDSAPEE